MTYQQDQKDETGKVVQSARGPSADFYIGIEHNLLDNVDPVLARAMDRLEKIYSETFWAIPESSSSDRHAWPLPRET